MFEKFFSQHAGDYRQRYEGTFGFFPTDSGKKLLVLLSRINAESEAPYVDFQDKNGVIYRLNADQDRGFEFIPPKSAWYNTKYGAMYIERVPARQWTRGLSSRNTSIKLLNKGLFENQKVSFDIVEEIYQSETPISLEKALENKSSYCFSPQIAACFYSEKLYVFGTNVGTISGDQNKFFVEGLENDLWNTEITDVFRRQGLNLELKK